ncbi:hypothetical protein JUJ52_08725 [Virgibacillus sp. AGTR]|uniref:hypothetical protein n=1 Tax=Virgibacillus sp. AGTR TaxID=2812055 RepID=UPI001D164F67|nr:hypothetical protein [Virgibacillus sp. AGTR]MCC2250049.1 hypothetical protein [Virgibacillus sp. AGTR]
MDKRLEEAKELVADYRNKQKSNNVLLTDYGLDLIDYLIQQAERAQELEAELDACASLYERKDGWACYLAKKNRRYEQYLKDIRDISTGSPHNFAVEALKGGESNG